ncbi:MAG: conjugal transfer protein [Bacillota bacterium]
MDGFDRTMVYRWLAGGLVWLLLLTAVIASVRSTNIVARASRVAAGAMTVSQEEAVAGVRELARAYAVEWATWSGGPDDYSKRLGVFLRKPDVAVPEGIQEVTAASVRSVEGSGEMFRVRVLLHTRRLTPMAMTEAQALPQAFVPVTREELIRLRQDGFYTAQDKTVHAWKDYLICVEVPVRVEGDGRPEIVGLPVIVSSGTGEGEAIEPRFNESALPEFNTFVKQFLGLYYGGGHLANFLTPDARVVSVPGWNLESVGEVRVDNSKTPTRAYIHATISAPGVGRLGQRIYMLVQPERGSYLVKDIRTTE